MSSVPTAPQRQAIREAARWYTRLSAEGADRDDQARWQTWYDSSPLHREAWLRMLAVSDSFSGLPGRLAASTLLEAGHTRRQVLYGLAVLLGGGVLGGLGWRSDARQAWTADYRTGVGELLSLRLGDGSQMSMDTDTAVDLYFDDRQRRLVVRRGQVLISTARDSIARPFMVDTRDGRVLALGTRFMVSVDDLNSEVAVLEKAVEVSASGRHGVRLEAGQRATFGPQGVGPLRANDAAVAAWAQGSLVAIDTPLAELLVQLSRYRPGLLSCDPAVARMKISGAFPISDTDLALTALENAFPLKVLRRTRFWVTVVPNS